MQLVPPFFSVQVDGEPLPFRFMQALAEIEVETSTEKAGILRLTFELSRTMTGDWDVLQFDLFRPLVPVRVKVGLGLPVAQTLINAYVHEGQLHNQNQPGASRYEVVAEDATATLMRHIQEPKPWPNTRDSDIAALIFGNSRYGTIPAPCPTPPTRTERDTTSNQRRTDIRYLIQLAARNGYECYVQPDPLSGRDVGYFGPPQLLAPPQGVLSSDFGAATNLLSFSMSYDMLQPRSAVAVAMDPLKKKPIQAQAQATLEPAMGHEAALRRIVPLPVERCSGTDAANPAEALRQAQARVNRTSRALRGRGDVDGLRFGAALRPGRPVEIRGVGRQYSGSYYVTEVNHRISRDGYSQSFSAWRNAVGLGGAELFIDRMPAIA